MMRLLLALVLMVNCGAAFALDATQQRRYEQIAGQLRCVVCQGQSVLDSEAEIAKEFKEILKQKIAAGESDAAIEAYFYDRYGDFVFLKPRKTSETALLWIAPLLVFAGLAGLMVWRRH